MKKTLTIIGAIFLVLIIIGGVVSAFEDTPTTTPDVATTSPTENAENAEKAIVSQPKSKWVYDTQTNEMDGVKSNIASIKSKNKIDFDFPYDGGSTFTFSVVSKLTNPKESFFFLEVDKGQFILNISNEEKLRVKFDDGEVYSINYGFPNNGSSNYIYPEYSSEFIEKLKQSKQLMIEAPFAMAGRKVIYFDIEGLDWK